MNNETHPGTFQQIIPHIDTRLSPLGRLPGSLPPETAGLFIAVFRTSVQLESLVNPCKTSSPCGS